MPPAILVIPQEITELTLLFCSPSDISSFSQTCRAARHLVYGNDQHLWRRLFLALFDDPRSLFKNTCLTNNADSHFDWMNQLQRRWKAMLVVKSLRNFPLELGNALHELTHVVRNAIPLPSTQEQSRDLAWVAAVLSGTDVYDTIGPHQLYAAHLWSLLGWRDDALNHNWAKIRAVRNASRAFVYDLRNYKPQSQYGPFLPSTNRLCFVDWQHIQAMIVVIQNNLLDPHLRHLWVDTRPPINLDAIRAYSAPGSEKRDPRDWAGVEGTWRRFVCFMDYRDLFKFNYGTNAYNPQFFDNDDFQEATRLIEIKLKITRIGNTTRTPVPPSSPTTSASTSSSSRSSSSPAPSSSSSSQPSTSSLPQNTPAPSERPVTAVKRYPTIQFVGRSRGGSGNESRIRGTVRMTADGNVRWRFVSVYDGIIQWSSEGIQIGNVCSAAGLVGSWTGALHEEGDPAGPFWMWKVSDDHPTHLRES